MDGSQIQIFNPDLPSYRPGLAAFCQLHIPSYMAHVHLQLKIPQYELFLSPSPPRHILLLQSPTHSLVPSVNECSSQKHRRQHILPAAETASCPLKSTLSFNTSLAHYEWSLWWHENRSERGLLSGLANKLSCAHTFLHFPPSWGWEWQ